jgi:uncharacterized protein
LLGKLTRRQRLLLLLDEIQELALPANDAFFKFVRTQLDINKERLFAVLTGSSITGLARLFGPRTAPFYRFGIEKSLPAFDTAFVDHMLNAFHRATGRKLEHSAAVKVFDAMQRQPAFREVVASLTAHPQWSLTDAYAEYRRRLAADSGFVRTWNELSAFDRAVLLLIASGEKSPYAQRALKRLGNALGGTTPSTHQVQSSLRRLTGRGLIQRDEQAKTYVVEDEQFGAWVCSIGAR